MIKLTLADHITSLTVECSMLVRRAAAGWPGLAQMSAERIKLCADRLVRYAQDQQDAGRTWPPEGGV